MILDDNSIVAHFQIFFGFRAKKCDEGFQKLELKQRIQFFFVAKKVVIHAEIALGPWNCRDK
jgi:hypothetical protein